MAARADQKWSTALIRRMARLADQEMSTTQIAKALGLTRGQVLGKMHRLGLKTKTQPRKWLNAALVEKLTELTNQRLSASEIGQALGLTRCQVSYRMRHLGLRTNPKSELPAWQAATITELINQGLSHGGIAETLGLTRGQVLGKMRRLGLKTTNQPKINTALVEKLTELTGQRNRPSARADAPPGQLQDAAPRPQDEAKKRVAGMASREDNRTNQPRTVSWRNCKSTRTNARSGSRQNASPRPQDQERS
jgi:hypothetical protein